MRKAKSSPEAENTAGTTSRYFQKSGPMALRESDLALAARLPFSALLARSARVTISAMVCSLGDGPQGEIACLGPGNHGLVAFRPAIPELGILLEREERRLGI